MNTVLLVLSVVVAGAATAQNTPSTRAQQKGHRVRTQVLPSEFPLDAARQLADLDAWEKAEEQYLKVDSKASAADRQRALEGIRTARQQIIREKREGAIAAARVLESLERWKEAEQAWADIAKNDPSRASEAAANAARIAPRITNFRWPEVIDDWLLRIGHILLIPAILFGCYRFARMVRRVRKRIKFQPFRANTDDAAKQMAFWLESTLADLRSPFSTLPTWPGLANTLPLMQLPGLQDDFELEDLEIGGVKAPLQQLFRSIAVPRARVSGHWYVGSVGGQAYVVVEKRRRFELEYSSSTQHPIVSAAGPAQDADLQRFAYAVFIEASR
jgi:hypothetical protein